MRTQIDSQMYKTMDDFEADVELIVNNCISYNAKDTVFYRAAVKLRDQVVMCRLHNKLGNISWSLFFLNDKLVNCCTCRNKRLDLNDQM